MSMDILVKRIDYDTYTLIPAPGYTPDQVLGALRAGHAVIKARKGTYKVMIGKSAIAEADSFWEPMSDAEYPTIKYEHYQSCLLYTSDAADEEDSVDLGG